MKCSGHAGHEHVDAARGAAPVAARPLVGLDAVDEGRGRAARSTASEIGLRGVDRGRDRHGRWPARSTSSGRRPRGVRSSS